MTQGFGYAAANYFLDTRARMGDSWMKALGEISDTLVNPMRLQVTEVDAESMDVFGHMTPPITPGLSTVYQRSLMDAGASKGLEA